MDKHTDLERKILRKARELYVLDGLKPADCVRVSIMEQDLLKPVLDVLTMFDITMTEYVDSMSKLMFKLDGHNN